MLDVDHGTYPFVTSSNTTAGFAATGTGLGPALVRLRARHRQGVHHARRRGPVPDRAVRRIRRASVARGPRVRRGHRPPAPLRLVRCRGAAALIIHSSVSGLCLTKLDVLDGLDTLQICVGYRSTARSAASRRCTPTPSPSGAGVRGNAGLEGIHHRRHLVRRRCRQRAQLPRAAAGAGRRAHRHHLHGAGPRPDHRAATSVRLRSCRVGALRQATQPPRRLREKFSRLTNKIYAAAGGRVLILPR